MQTNKLKELKVKENEILEKIEKKRRQLGGSDGPMQSRFPTGRFELENYIELLENQLESIRKEISSLT